MKNLTIGDLKLALRQLLGDLHPELTKSETGKLYEKRLRAKQKEIEAIPDAAARKVPFATELADQDAQHDALGSSIFFLTQAIEAHPKLSEDMKRAAADVRSTFIPQLGVLRAPYADEAARALENRPELAKLKASLKQMPVPGGGTAYEWVRDFLSAGDAIDKLLQKRAGLLATEDNAAGTAPLRSATVGLLGRFRDALRDELSDPDNKLPADHEATLFAYIDKLSADRSASPAPEPSPPAPAASPDAPPAPPEK